MSKPGSDQPHVLLTKVDDRRNAQSVLRFSSILPHLNAAFVDKDTHHRIVKPLSVLNLEGRHSEGWGGATFVLGGVTCHELVVAESSALAA